jgi:hypothetical protein
MEGKKVHSKGSHYAILIHMCLEQTGAYFSPTICGGPENGSLFSFIPPDNNAALSQTLFPAYTT